MDYDISIISYEMPVEQAEEGNKKKKQKAKGQLLVGVKLGFNKEKKQLTNGLLIRRIEGSNIRVGRI